MLDVFNSGLDILTMVMTAMGGIAVVWGGFQIFEGYQNDNAGSKASGTKWLVGGAGFVVIAQQLIPKIKDSITIAP